MTDEAEASVSSDLMNTLVSDLDREVERASEDLALSISDVEVDVATMFTTLGSDHYVRITVNGRELTPHMFKTKGRAEYEVAEWKWLFGQGPKPSLLDFDTHEAPVLALPGDRFHHIKRGTDYTVIGEARINHTYENEFLPPPLNDGQMWKLYRGDDGVFSVRPHAEFEDGRFKPIPRNLLCLSHRTEPMQEWTTTQLQAELHDLTSLRDLATSLIYDVTKALHNREAEENDA